MRQEAPLPAGTCIQLEGQMIGVQTVRSVDHECAQRIFSNDAMQLFDSRLCEMRR